ncbi:hypothetical protein LCGC14_2566060 [marine sediment metagenome]|uniref:Uncharacterized protein n=1 Tax=marine sediment metagenome TaxID=412755 RepID=A0A0F9DBI8_9ZZZZ
MGSQYTTVTVTPVLHRRSVIDTTPVDMLQCEDATGGPFSFKRWYICPICTLTYRKDKMVEIEGTFYCKRFKHYLDIIEDLKEKSSVRS